MVKDMEEGTLTTSGGLEAGRKEAELKWSTDGSDNSALWIVVLRLAATFTLDYLSTYYST